MPDKEIVIRDSIGVKELDEPIGIDINHPLFTEKAPKVSDGTSLGHVPEKEKWEFDESVTKCFDDMLKRSIPQYDQMRELTFQIGKRFVKPKTAVIDLGCSRGEALVPFVQTFGSINEFYGVEISDPMIEAARSRFKVEEMYGYVKIFKMDLRDSFPDYKSSLILCVLTMQFIPINYRQDILKKIHHSLERGGACIIVEKVLGEGAELDETFINVYHDYKMKNGYSFEEVERKKFALEGVLVPLTASMNESMFRKAGFTNFDCFYRWANFCGWILIR